MIRCPRSRCRPVTSRCLLLSASDLYFRQICISPYLYKTDTLYLQVTWVSVLLATIYHIYYISRWLPSRKRPSMHIGRRANNGEVVKSLSGQSFKQHIYEYIFTISPANRIWNRFLVVTAPNSRKYQLKLITPKKGIHHHRRNWLVWHRVQRQRRNRRMSRNRVWRSRFFRLFAIVIFAPMPRQIASLWPIIASNTFHFRLNIIIFVPAG